MTNEPNQPIEQQIPEELKELVIARLNVIPNGVKMSIGADGEFTRGELIEKVNEGGAIGQQIVKSQLEFLQALGEGRFLEELMKTP